MAKFIRYALATVCFAASVGCLALWIYGLSTPGVIQVELFHPIMSGSIRSGQGRVIITDYNSIASTLLPTRYGITVTPRHMEPETRLPAVAAHFKLIFDEQGQFGHWGTLTFFPIWYPALIFALAGVAALRFRRQFSIRSALIAVSVVAALLGMAAVL